MLNKSQHVCLGCGSASLANFLDLGRMPLANSYLPADKLCDNEETFPLAIGHCSSCHLVQLIETIRPEKMFSEYAYFSSYSESFLTHARLMAEALIQRFNLNSSSQVLEIASNDGYLLQYFQKRGVAILGIEPAANVALVARERGIPTMQCFFEPATVPTILRVIDRADVVIGNNVLAHVPDINPFLNAVAKCLKPTGAAVFEFPYLRDLLDKVEFDTIYHEHVFYYSLIAVNNLATRSGLELWDVIPQRIHGGSLRIFLQHPGARPIESRVVAMLAEEDRNGLSDLGRFESFGHRVMALKKELLSMLGGLKQAGKRIAAYGAPAKGNTLLNYCGIGRDIVEFTVDRNPNKQGCFLPGSHVPILPPEQLLARMPDYTLMLPWNITDEILEQQSEYLRAGGRFILPVPQPRIIQLSAD